MNLLWWCAPMGTSTRCAVIVEPRKHRDLVYVLRNVSHFLGPEWSVVWFHGTDNAAWAREIQSTLPNLHLIALSCADLSPLEKYSELLTTEGFWNQIPHPIEHILIFQTDALLCRRGADAFLGYDYIGAEWYFGGFGNGGLSLRSKTTMLRILALHRRPVGQAEDLWYMQMLHADEMARLPDMETVRHFSVESVYYPFAGSPLGMHKPYWYLKPDDLMVLLSKIQYPAA